MVYIKHTTPIHAASLVDRSLHSPALLELLKLKLTRSLIYYLIDCVIETAHCALTHFTATSSSNCLSSREKFTHFVTRVLYGVEVKVPVLLVALVYIARAKPQLHIAVEQWAYERVFLGALVLAYKYVNDATLKNYHWAVYTGAFGARDIGRVEREYLDVLDYRLGITEDDILAHHGAIMALVHPPNPLSTSKMTPTIPVFHHPFVQPRSHPLHSCWSPGSSDDGDVDMDVDSDCSSTTASLDSCSTPRTPGDAQMLQTSSKTTQFLHPVADVTPVNTPSQHQVTPISVPIPIQFGSTMIPQAKHASVPVQTQTQIQNQLLQVHQPLMASAFQFLRSFPVPMFYSKTTNIPTSTSTTSLDSFISCESSPGESLSVPAVSGSC